MPTDGIAQNAQKITKAHAPMSKGGAIYDWVENTERNPKTRGCGVGDIKAMLESNALNGKCADLNALFVALARASGVPARDVYGVRVADSARGYKSLGKSGDVTKAQHCRAEFYAQGVGWVPVDPADVRKVVLEKPADARRRRQAARRCCGRLGVTGWLQLRTTCACWFVGTGAS
jgi:transglutaminase-like putative cysteine protease